MMYHLSYLNIKHGIYRGSNWPRPQHILVFKYPIRDRVKLRIRNFSLQLLWNHMRNPTNLVCKNMNNHVFRTGMTRLLSRKKNHEKSIFSYYRFSCEISQKANIFALFSTKEMRINAKFLANQKLRNFKQFFNLTGNPNLEAVM